MAISVAVYVIVGLVAAVVILAVFRRDWSAQLAVLVLVLLGAIGGLFSDDPVARAVYFSTSLLIIAVFLCVRLSK